MGTTVEIVIGHVDIDVDTSKIKKDLVKDDELLIEAIEDHKSDLDPDVEVFDQFKNAIVTEEGWYIAIRSETMKKIQNG